MIIITSFGGFLIIMMTFKGFLDYYDEFLGFLDYYDEFWGALDYYDEFRNSRADFFEPGSRIPLPRSPRLISLKLAQEIPVPRARSALGRRRRRRQGD